MIRMPTRFSATRLILRDDHGLKPAALRPVRLFVAPTEEASELKHRSCGMYNAVSERGGFFSGQGFAASETLTAWQEAWDHRSEKKQRPGQEQQQQHQQQEEQQQPQPQQKQQQQDKTR